MLNPALARVMRSVIPRYRSELYREAFGCMLLNGLEEGQNFILMLPKISFPFGATNIFRVIPHLKKNRVSKHILNQFNQGLRNYEREPLSPFVMSNKKKELHQLGIEIILNLSLNFFQSMSSQ